MTNPLGRYAPGRGHRRRATDRPALALPTGAALGTHSDAVWAGLCAEWAGADYRAGRIDVPTYLAAQATAAAALDAHLTLTLAAAGFAPTSGGRKGRGR